MMEYWNGGRANGTVEIHGSKFTVVFFFQSFQMYHLRVSVSISEYLA